jgi:hypothetical protein
VFSEVRKRSDVKILANGSFGAAWAVEPPQVHPHFKQVMLLLYGFGYARNVFRHYHEATHEFMLYHVSPATPIDFDKNLWEQRHVSPILPARAGFQITASSDTEAFEVVNVIAEKVMSLELMPLIAEELRQQVPRGKMIVVPEFEHYALYDKMLATCPPPVSPHIVDRLNRNAHRIH